MKSYKEDFPLLRNSSIAYLDNAATAQRPEAVLKAEREFYEKYNANPLRGLYQLGMDATDCYEKARETVRDFLHAKKSSEIIFTRNTTESINLVAYSYALNNLKEGDELLVGIDSHHSNLLPWQMAARVTGAKLVFLDCEMDGSYTKEAIEKVITGRTKFARASVSAGRINEILETEVVLRDPEKEEKEIPEKKGVVEFHHVSFTYPGAEDPVLHDIDFTARPGETTAIIGSTGCGKSTVVNLIPRFYDVTEGEILVDGVDVRKMSQHTLHSKLGYVPQKGVLFSGTIASNIAYSNDAMSDADIHKAADIAQASDFIEEKEEQYDSPIAQGGTNVSGGQKQRLSIARAIAGKPEIYIFDDSFSALDYKTDAALRKALKEETADATTIIVAQRISTILHAEQIIVLDEGRIAGIGTHKELLKSCEVYHQIAASQLSKEELDHE